MLAASMHHRHASSDEPLHPLTTIATVPPCRHPDCGKAMEMAHFSRTLDRNIGVIGLHEAGAAGWYRRKASQWGTRPRSWWPVHGIGREEGFRRSIRGHSEASIPSFENIENIALWFPRDRKHVTTCESCESSKPSPAAIRVSRSVLVSCSGT